MLYLAKNGFPGENTLTYLSAATVTQKNSLITETQEGRLKNLKKKEKVKKEIIFHSIK
jgi:hypothetical protein